MLLSAARRYFPLALRACRAGHIHGSAVRDCRIMLKKRLSPSMEGTEGISLGREGSEAQARV